MSNKHPLPAPSFSRDILHILFLRLWTCEKWWVSLRAHCRVCFPTCGLLFLSKPQPVPELICTCCPPPAWQGCDLPKLPFCARCCGWTLQRAQQERGAGTWCRLGALGGWDLLLWLLRAGCCCLWNHSLCYFPSSTCTRDWKTVSKLNSSLRIPTSKSIGEQTLWEEAICWNKDVNWKVQFQCFLCSTFSTIIAVALNVRGQTLSDVVSLIALAHHGVFCWFWMTDYFLYWFGFLM